MENKTTTQQFIDQYKKNVSSAYPSIYTKDDVIKLLNDLLTDLNNNLVEEPAKFDWDNFNDNIYDIVFNAIDDNYGQCFEIDNDKCELSIGQHNRIEVDEVAYDFDSSELSDRVTTEIQKYVNRTKTQTQQNN